MVVELPYSSDQEALEEPECRREVSEKLDQYPLGLLLLACRCDDEKGDVDAHHHNLKKQT